MSVTIKCSGCGKQLNVRDEYIGRRLKCPQCGAIIQATAETSARTPAGAKMPLLHLSPGVIAFLVLLIVIPGLLAFWKYGPGRVRDQWEKLLPDATDNVKDVVTRGLQAYLSQRGAYDPSKPHHTPEALDLVFMFGPLHLTMPQVVRFAGTTTQGAFTGGYEIRTGHVEADVEIGGQSFPGAGVVRHGNEKIRVTGRVQQGNVSVEVNGKPAEIVWPRSND